MNYDTGKERALIDFNLKLIDNSLREQLINDHLHLILYNQRKVTIYITSCTSYIGLKSNPETKIEKKKKKEKRKIGKKVSFS